MSKKVLITMKVTPDERELFKQKADEAKMTLTDLIKHLVMNKKVRYQKINRVDPNLIFEINAIGNNLNQIARKLNENEKIETLPLLLEIREELQKIREQYAN